MSKARKPSRVRLPSADEDRQLVAAAKDDPDALPLSRQQLKAMVPIKALRGRPKTENAKQLVSIRYSPEVLEYFRSTGAGWQARMDAVLKRYVARHSRA